LKVDNDASHDCADHPSTNGSGLAVQQLEKAEFRYVGEWIAEEGKIKLDFKPEQGQATVYAFLLDGELVYIGLTQTCFYRRMQGYRNGKGSQRTNVRIREFILKALAAGRQVRVMAAVPEERLQWKGLPVSLAVGLESGLIEKFRKRRPETVWTA
jgi:hypothetical protein